MHGMSPHDEQRFAYIPLDHEDVVAGAGGRGHETEVAGFGDAHADRGEEVFHGRSSRGFGVGGGGGAVDEGEEGADEVGVFFEEGGLGVGAGFGGGGGAGGDVEWDFEEFGVGDECS